MSDRPLVSTLTYGATNATPVVVELLGATPDERRLERAQRPNPRARTVDPYEPAPPRRELPPSLAAKQRPLFAGAPKGSK